MAARNVCPTFAHEDRPAKERLAVFRDCRMAGFWLSMIEPFAGGPSEWRLAGALL
jgi:hypothetical protein